MSPEIVFSSIDIALFALCFAIEFEPKSGYPCPISITPGCRDNAVISAHKAPGPDCCRENAVANEESSMLSSLMVSFMTGTTMVLERRRLCLCRSCARMSCNFVVAKLCIYSEAKLCIYSEVQFEARSFCILRNAKLYYYIKQSLSLLLLLFLSAVIHLLMRHLDSRERIQTEPSQSDERSENHGYAPIFRLAE